MEKVKLFENKKVVTIQYNKRIEYDSKSKRISIEIVSDDREWFSPPLHPLAAYSILKHEFSNYGDFITTMDVDISPEVDFVNNFGTDLTDHFYILFESEMKYNATLDTLWDKLYTELQGTEDEREERLIEYQEAFNDDDFIEYCFNSILGEEPTETSIVNYIEFKNIEDTYVIFKEFLEIGG